MDSDVNNLILGYLKDHNFNRTAREFRYESRYSRKGNVLNQVIEEENLMLNLSQVVKDYCAMKKVENELTRKGEASCILSLWGQFDAIINQLKILTIGKQSNQSGTYSKNRSASNAYYTRVFAKVIPRVSGEAAKDWQTHIPSTNAAPTASEDATRDGEVSRRTGSQAVVEASPHEVSLTRLDSKAYYEEQGDAGALHGVSVGSNLTHPERLSDMEMGCEDHVKSPKRKRIRPKKLDNTEGSVPGSQVIQDPLTELLRRENTAIPAQTNSISGELNTIFDALLNSKSLQEKIADNINKVATSSQINVDFSKETQVNESGTALMPTINIEEVLNITRSDPSFESLFATLDDIETSPSAIQTPMKTLQLAEQGSFLFEPFQDAGFVSDQVDQLNPKRDLFSNEPAIDQPDGFTKIESNYAIADGANAMKRSANRRKNSSHSEGTAPGSKSLGFQALQSNSICNIYIKKKKNIKSGSWKPPSYLMNSAVLTGSGSMSRARMNQTFKTPYCNVDSIKEDASDVRSSGNERKGESEVSRKCLGDGNEGVRIMDREKDVENTCDQDLSTASFNAIIPQPSNEFLASVPSSSQMTANGNSCPKDTMENFSGRAKTNSAFNEKCTHEIAETSLSGNDLTVKRDSGRNFRGNGEEIFTHVDGEAGRSVRFDFSEESGVKGDAGQFESGKDAINVEITRMQSGTVKEKTRPPRKGLPRKSILKKAETCKGILNEEKDSIGIICRSSDSKEAGSETSFEGVDCKGVLESIAANIPSCKGELNEEVDLECREKLDFGEDGNSAIYRKTSTERSNHVGECIKEENGVSKGLDNRVQCTLEELSCSRNGRTATGKDEVRRKPSRQKAGKERGRKTSTGKKSGKRGTKRASKQINLGDSQECMGQDCATLDGGSTIMEATEGMANVVVLPGGNEKGTKYNVCCTTKVTVANAVEIVHRKEEGGISISEEEKQANGCVVGEGGGYDSSLSSTALQSCVDFDLLSNATHQGDTAMKEDAKKDLQTDIIGGRVGLGGGGGFIPDRKQEPSLSRSRQLTEPVGYQINSLTRLAESENSQNAINIDIPLRIPSVQFNQFVQANQPISDSAQLSLYDLRSVTNYRVDTAILGSQTSDAGLRRTNNQDENDIAKVPPNSQPGFSNIGFEIISSTVHSNLSNDEIQSTKSEDFSIYLSDDSNDSADVRSGLVSTKMNESGGRYILSTSVQREMSGGTKISQETFSLEENNPRKMVTTKGFDGFMGNVKDDCEEIMDGTNAKRKRKGNNSSRKGNSRKKKPISDDADDARRSLEIPQNLDIDHFLSKLKYSS